MKPPTCSLDFLPTKFISSWGEVIDIAGPSIFTHSFKHAVVQPLLKKPNLNPSVVNNFRPISKLLFLSKALEKVVSMQLLAFMSHNIIKLPTTLF